MATLLLAAGGDNQSKDNDELLEQTYAKKQLPPDPEHAEPSSNGCGGLLMLLLASALHFRVSKQSSARQARQLTVVTHRRAQRRSRDRLHARHCRATRRGNVTRNPCQQASSLISECRDDIDRMGSQQWPYPTALQL